MEVVYTIFGFIIHCMLALLVYGCMGGRFVWLALYTQSVCSWQICRVLVPIAIGLALYVGALACVCQTIC